MRKIAYVIECMHNSGGMERVLSVCANALCRELDVSIVTLYQKGRPYYFPMDDSVQCYDLGVENVANRQLLKGRLKDFLMSRHFDIVVSMGGIDMYYLHSVKDGSKKIVWFHFAFNVAYTAWLGDSPSLFKKLRGYLQQFKRIISARKFDRVVAISNADCHTWQKYTHKAILIYNPITIQVPQTSTNTEKALISVGRLDYQKGFDILIDVWRIVSEKHPNWQLHIFGDGPLREQLKKIELLQLPSSISLCGRTTNIGEKYAQHSIYVMSSRTEAFGLVLLEAASCGLPLIAFDCPSGPSEIVEDGKNGFLVEKVGDVQTMADRICHLIENEALRRQMGEKARQMVQKFSVEAIRKQWMDLFDGM